MTRRVHGWGRVKHMTSFVSCVRFAFPGMIQDFSVGRPDDGGQVQDFGVERRCEDARLRPHWSHRETRGARVSQISST